MNDILTTQNIMFALLIITMIFNVYNSFKKPQIDADMRDSVFAIQLKTMQADLVNLRDNHIHTLDLKITTTNENVNLLTIAVAKLETIIDERMPRKG